MDNITLKGWLRKGRVQPGGEGLEFLLELDSPLQVGGEQLNEIETKNHDVELRQYLDMRVEAVGELSHQMGINRPDYWIFIARIVRPS